MKRWHLASAIAGAVFGAVVAAAAVALAQAPAAAPALIPPCTAPAVVQDIGDDTFISLKDHGDSQTVIVYKVDDKGMARLTHKAKFFY
ncbi:MAG: hypothetical protein JXR83_05380 [Deltaproteobacteria bacterium]|nr:hypothetical protein [Deltaproteobacteria bacterium]